MRRVLLAALATTAIGFASMPAPASAGIVFDFGSHPNNLGTSEVYADSGAPGTPLTVTATGYNASNALTDLFGKQGAGDERGLGLTNDPTGDNEIALGYGYVQLDIGSLLPYASSLSLVSFFMNSTTENEMWAVFGTNTAGAAPVGLPLLTGSDENQHLLPSFGTFRYYDFYETSSNGGKNVLLSKLTANVIGTPFNGGVPEPGTWAMMLLGFGGIGMALRRSRKANGRLLQIA